MTIALVVLTVLVTLSGVYAFLRIRHWRDMYWSQEGIYNETLNRALESESAATEAVQELEWLKNIVLQIATRKSVALLTDEQVNLICQSIAQLVVSSMRDPTRLN